MWISEGIPQLSSQGLVIIFSINEIGRKKPRPRIFRASGGAGAAGDSDSEETTDYCAAVVMWCQL